MTQINETSSAARSDDEVLVDWLRDRDVYCPLCKYNVRNLTSPRCPECGNGLRLAVEIVDPYLKAWITLLVAMCVGAGIGIPCAIGLTRGIWKDAPNWDRLVFILTILMIPCAAALIFYRRRFQRLSRGTQRVLAWVGAGIMVICYVVMFSNMD